ncbi:MAG: GNAT family N-acetyltransferase [Chloroflexi bacterium]|nr:GNAT family N-acetyltransferase [Chloroflexota bacterium]
MKVRVATVEDVDAIALLNREVQQLHADAQPHLFKQPDDLEAVKADIRDRMLADADGRVLLVEDGGQPVGYVYARFFWRPETAYTYAVHFLHIDQISVKSEWRHTGCGRALIEAVFDLARAAGVEQVTLDTGDFNRNAQAFFARMGFQMFMHRMAVSVEQVERS